MIIGINGEIGSGKDTVGKIIQFLTTVTKDYGEHYALEQYLQDDSLAYKWLENHAVFQNKKFADKLKDFVCVLIGCTRRILEDHKFKDTPLGEEWYKYYTIFNGVKYFYSTYEECLKFSDTLNPPTLIQLTPRLLMQLIGTECGRDIIHPDIWVNGLFNEYKIDKITNEYPDWIITDLRFPNELARIKKYEGVSIKVIRPKEVSTGDQNIDFILNKTPNFGVTPHYSEIALNNARFDYTIINDGSLIDLKNKVDIILKDIKYFEKFLNYI